MEGSTLYGFAKPQEGKLKKNRFYILRHRISFFQDPNKTIVYFSNR